jgi:glyoxylase-like metal-dependent hydrolase (beta-lactamase superfamily II)
MVSRGNAADVTEVAPDVFVARGTDVNWALLREGSELTLVDAGYPGDTDRVLASIRELGCRPEDVRAVLLTHAHVDHVGAVNHLHERHGVPLYTDPVEVRHARREYLEQAGPKDVVRNLGKPGVLTWAVRISRVGATRTITVPHAQPFPSPGALDLPGRPQPVATHGHTSGHTAYHLAAVGAVLTGDALVTAHPTSRRSGPQVLAPMFNHGDPVAALDALEGLAADLVLPGHGPVLQLPIADAVARARVS